MAVFDPRVNPTNDPDYTNRSRGVDIPQNLQPRGQETNEIQPRGVQEGNKAAEFAGKAEAAGLQARGLDYQLNGNKYDTAATAVGIADNAIKFGANTTDMLIKKQIEREVYDQANQTREGYITQLEGIKAKLAGPGMKLDSFLDANASMDELPQELQNFGATTDALAEARAEGAVPGKINQVDYATKLQALAKDLRNRYAGHKEYVDAQMQKVTGHDPANFMISQQLSDINRQMTSQDAMTKQALGLLNKYPGLPEAQIIHDALMSGTVSGKTALDLTYKAIGPYEQRRMRNEMIKWNREDVENSQGTRRLLATQEIDGRVTTATGEAIQNFQINILGAKDKATFLDFVQKAGSGQYTNQQLEAAGQQLTAQIPLIETHMMQMGNQRNPETGRSLIDDAGGLEAYRNKVKASMEPFKTYIASFYDGKHGFVGQLGRSIQGKMDQVTSDMQNDPSIGPEWTILQANSKLGNNDLNNFYLELFRKGFDQRMQGFAAKYAGEMGAQTKRTETGKDTTLNDFVEYGQKNGVLTNKVLSGNVAYVIDSIKKSNISEAIKENLIRAAFSDGNLGFVEKLNKDGRASDGSTIQGQYYTYRQMTSPEVTQAVAQLGKAKPELWENYTKWATNTFRNLYVREMRDLEASSYSDQLKISWIKDRGQFQVDYIGKDNLNAPDMRFQRNKINEVKSQIYKLNDGLANLGEIAKAAGHDKTGIEAYLLKTMYESGWRATEGVKDLPSAVTQELYKARLADEQQKAARKKIEDEVGSKK